VDWEPRAVDVVGNEIDMSLKGVQPYLEFYRGEVEAQAELHTGVPRQSLNEDQILSSPALLPDDDQEDDTV
jgi:hypothetical protein